MPAHVRKGDTVMVTSGSFKGQVGEVIRVNPKHSEVIVKGVNLKTKHMKPTRVNPQGSIITRSRVPTQRGPVCVHRCPALTVHHRTHLPSAAGSFRLKFPAGRGGCCHDTEAVSYGG